MTTTPSPEALAEIVHKNGPVVIDAYGEGLAWRPLDYGTWTVLRPAEREQPMDDDDYAALSAAQNPTPTDSGEVVQGDRDAADELFRDIIGEVVCAFRDHRLAFSRPEPVGDEALVERVAKALHSHQCARLLPGSRSVGAFIDEREFWMEFARAAIQAIPAPATDAGQSADSGMAFTARDGARCLERRIDSIGELLRLINGGARLFDVRIASLPKSPSAGEEA